MIIKINDKDYELSFDFGFIKRLNSEFGLVQNGINLKGAIDITMNVFLLQDVEMMSIYMRCANEHLTEEMVESYIESVASADKTGKKLEKLFDDVTNAVKNGMLTRAPFKKAMKQMDEAEEMLKNNRA